MVRQKNVGQCLGALDDVIALWKLNLAPENRPGPKRKGSSSNHFQGRNVKLRGCFFGWEKDEEIREDVQFGKFILTHNF